jgi:translation elongation factor EF-Tu-like GTPase
VSRPRVTVDVVFLEQQEGGRQLPPDVGQSGLYRPHIVLQHRSVRGVISNERNVPTEGYLGVAFVEGPTSVRIGETVRCTLELCYFPNVPYAQVGAGATFTIREGASVVGHGVVIERTDGRLDTAGNV